MFSNFLVRVLKGPFPLRAWKKAFFVCFIAFFCACFSFNCSLQLKINKRDKECSFPLRAWKRAFFVSFIDLQLKRAVKIETSAKKNQ